VGKITALLMDGDKQELLGKGWVRQLFLPRIYLKKKIIIIVQ